MALALSKQFLSSHKKLVLGGKGTEEYETKLKQLAEGLGVSHKIEFIGLIQGEAKEQMYAKSFCSFLVSESENFGNVVIEALAQGTPVITSLGTPWAVLEENAVGRNIENSPKEIAQAIDELLLMPENQYVEMSSRCKKFCSEEFDIVSNVDKWIAKYK